MGVHQLLHRMRRIYWKARRPVSVGVRVAVLSDDEVLLVQHTYGGDALYLPGGAPRRGERVTRAALRELREEVGPLSDEDALSLHGVFTNLRQGKTDHVVVFTVPRSECRPVDHAQPSREIRDARWVDRRVLPEGTSPGTRRRIAEINGERSRSFEW